MKRRNSSIELLKIIAIIFIVISHSAQTVGSLHPELGDWECFIDLSHVTVNMSHFVLILLRHLGVLGNNIFLICSIFFLCDSDNASMKKVFQIIADVWIISVLNLAIFSVFYENISGKIVVKSLFPTIFCNNWYITCYLLIFLLHPYLNMMIKKMTQRQLISFNLISAVLYLGFVFISRSLLFYSNLIMFMVLYFIIAYMKIYQHSFSSSNRVNIIFLIIGIGGTIGLVLITNILGQHVVYLEDKVLYWVTNNNPFIILTAVGLFNLFRKKNRVNLKINKFAGLSLFIYIIHENILVRTYFRPLIYAYIYDTFGYQYLVLWVLGFAVVLFVASALLGTLYRATIQKVSVVCVNKVYIRVENAWRRILDKIMKID